MVKNVLKARVSTGAHALTLPFHQQTDNQKSGHFVCRNVLKVRFALAVSAK